jgi:E3 ubiquitin-protein ligase BAH
MYRWRELFDLYLQAGVFFSTHELDRGRRDSTAAAQQRGLKNLFKLPASHQALDRFIRINITLLRNLKFQEINQKAISKILKSMSLIHFLPVVFCYAITRLSAV